LLSIEIEFEWIRQFFIQGQKHHELHVWWHKPITEFKNSMVTIEQRLVKISKAVIDSRRSGKFCSRFKQFGWYRVSNRLFG
jgi:hypothetical protein